MADFSLNFSPPSQSTTVEPLNFTPPDSSVGQARINATNAKTASDNAGGFWGVAKQTLKEIPGVALDEAKSMAKGAGEFALSAGEAPYRLAAKLPYAPNSSKLSNQVIPPTTVPGLSFLGPMQSFQSQAAQGVVDGKSVPSAIGSAALDTVINDPIGIAFKPALAILGIAGKILGKTELGQKAIGAMSKWGGAETKAVVPEVKAVAPVAKVVPEAPKLPPEAIKPVEAPTSPLTTEARKYKTAEEFVKAQGKPKYQHRMLRDTAESDLAAIKRDGFDSQYIDAFNKPRKPFEAKFSKQPNVNPTNLERGNYLKTKKGETVLLPPQDAVVAGKNGDFIKPGWKPTESQIVKIEYDGQPVKEALANKLTDIYNQAHESAPVTSSTKVSGIAKDIQTKAVENGLTDTYKDLATYEPRVIKEQAAKIADVISKNPEDLGAIVRGEKPVPEGISPSYLVTAVDKYATQTGNGKLLQDLVSSKLTGEGSVHASELRMLAERDQSSALQALKEVQGARAGKTAKIAGEAKKIQSHVAKVAKTQDWHSFVDSITC